MIQCFFQNKQAVWGLFLLAVVGWYSPKVVAQSDRLGGWYSVTLNHHFTPHVLLSAELQTRAQGTVTDFYYHEIQGGVTYQFPTRNAVMFGLGNYEVYPFPGNFKRPASSDEFRMWEQLSLNNNLGRIRIEHRYRLEQRWLQHSYQNRLRYRLNAVVPINHSNIQPHTWFVTFSNELYVIEKAPYLERNRIFGGLGYQFSKLFAYQLGITRFYDNRSATGKNFIQSSWLFSSNRSVSKRPRHPSSMD